MLNFLVASKSPEDFKLKSLSLLIRMALWLISGESIETSTNVRTVTNWPPPTHSLEPDLRKRKCSCCDYLGGSLCQLSVDNNGVLSDPMRALLNWVLMEAFKWQPYRIYTVYYTVYVRGAQVELAPKIKLSESDYCHNNIVTTTHCYYNSLNKQLELLEHAEMVSKWTQPGCSPWLLRQWPI